MILSIVLLFSGTAQEFKRKFEAPILRGRDSTATDAEHARGQEKLQEVRRSNFYFGALTVVFTSKRRMYVLKRYLN